MTTEIDVKTAKGFVTIALIGAVAAVLVVLAVEYIPKIRTKLGI
jgi:hypothetical protein